MMLVLLVCWLRVRLVRAGHGWACLYAGKLLSQSPEVPSRFRDRTMPMADRSALKQPILLLRRHWAHACVCSASMTRDPIWSGPTRQAADSHWRSVPSLCIPWCMHARAQIRVRVCTRPRVCSCECAHVRPMAYGLWPMAAGLCSRSYGLRCRVCSLEPMAAGVWPIAYPSRAHGSWPMACSLRPVGYGL